MVHVENGGRRILFQVWEFDGAHYDLSIFVVHDVPGEPPVDRVQRTRYYAVSRYQDWPFSSIDDVREFLARQHGMEDIEKYHLEKSR